MVFAVNPAAKVWSSQSFPKEKYNVLPKSHDLGMMTSLLSSRSALIQLAPFSGNLPDVYVWWAQVLLTWSYSKGRIQTKNGSVQTLRAPQKLKREKDNCCCLINFSSKQWASLCSVQKNILYTQNEVAKNVQNNINEESRPDPQLKTLFPNFFLMGHW